MKLSTLILAKNEEEMIEDCLSQLSFADEIIILDQNSTDKTVAIANKFTDKVFSSKSEALDESRNELAQKAKGEWLLYVDADERLTPELVNEIKSIVNGSGKAGSNVTAAYYIPRRNFILGKWLKHGGWWPDYVPRLFKRENFPGWQGAIHESPKVNGKAGRLNSPINHLTARSMDLMLTKSAKWAKLEAELYAKSNAPKVSQIKVLKFSLKEFVRRYFIKLGFLDGKVGFMAAAYQALHNAMILTYLWEIQNNTAEKFKNQAEKL